MNNLEKMGESNNEYITIFLEEAKEYINTLNECLMMMEKDKGNKRIVDKIFRIAHTIKSSAASIGYNDLSALSHQAEDLMTKVRSGEAGLTPEIIDILFEYTDTVNLYVESIRKKDPATPGTPEMPVTPDIRNVKKKLEKELAHLQEKKEEKTVTTDPVAEEGCPLVLVEYEKRTIMEEKKQGKNVFLLTVAVDPREQIKWLRTELILNKLNEMGEIIRIIPDKEEMLKNTYEGIFSVILTSSLDADAVAGKVKADLIWEVRIATINDPEKVRINNKPLRPFENGEKEKETGNYLSRDEAETLMNQAKKINVITSLDTIRVPVNKLDNLMNLVGELLITNSGLKEVEKQVKGLLKKNIVYSRMNFITDKLANISSELQSNVMNMRMLPIAYVFTQFHRVVHDLAKEQNKQIELVLKGEDTELDKKVIDEIGAPLTHLVRNSVDHGLETMEERIKNKKPAVGTITLSAMSEGNHIILSVKDDGKGVDIEKVKETALAKGLISREELSVLNDEEVMKFIFKPGFSTKETVSTISGRGVGLDVVYNTITNLGGTVRIRNEKGQGSEFIILLPLTLAVTAGILVRLNTSLYAIPIANIKECIKIKRKDIQTINGKYVIKLREHILPLINLCEMFEETLPDTRENKETTIMVVHYQGRVLGLVIDQIMGEQEIVLKPLEKNYKNIKGLAGAAILGDGRIVLVLDVAILMGLVKEPKNKSLSTAQKEEHRERIPA
ncbi:MAG: chemotaxis protein CheA [bacterium]|nr:chemotaxis protein CheA [bacterium]